VHDCLALVAEGIGAQGADDARQIDSAGKRGEQRALFIEAEDVRGEAARLELARDALMRGDTCRVL
jgi:hypothetical protein